MKNIQITMTPCTNSSQVLAYGFDKFSCTLAVEFKGGDEYRYKNVPSLLYEELKAAESAGKFIAANVKGVFEFEKMVPVATLTVATLAAILSGREYTKEITKEEAAQAKAAGLVVVYGASDDLMEFSGAIRDELGAFDGTTAYLTNEGLLTNDCEDSDCPFFKKMKDKAATIKAAWHNNGSADGGFTWTYETAIPHETFEITDGEERYCRGIVFALKDVVTA